MKPSAEPATTARRTFAKLDRPAIVREGLQMALGCVAISLILWLVIPTFGRYGYFNVLVHSLAIGMLAWTLMAVGGRLVGLYSLQPRWLLVAILMVGGFVAYGLGSLLARLMLGIELGGFFEMGTSGLMTNLFVTGLITIVCTAYFFSRERMADLRAQAAEEAHRAEAARLAMLRAQIDPHMLFNTLSALRALIATDGPRAIEMLDHLNRFLRATLDGSRQATTTLDDEFQLLEHYLELMSVRMGERLRPSLDLPAPLKSVTVPALLLQPLVENAIRHGLEPSMTGGQLRVKARRDTDTGAVQIQISDTGVGIADTRKAHDGFGMASVRQRLDAMFGAQASMRIESPDPATGCGTRITLAFTPTRIPDPLP